MAFNILSLGKQESPPAVSPHLGFHKDMGPEEEDGEGWEGCPSRSWDVAIW
jgi:hypothetical protein